jgi:hypothetical protein
MLLTIISEPHFSGTAAGLALLLSGAALWSTSRSAVHAKRKADALLGDLPPNFALYPAPKRPGTEAAWGDLILRVDNHNRRPIRVTKVELRAPAKSGLVAYLLDGSRETLLASGERRHNEVSTDLVLPGTPPGALQFHSSTLRLVLTSSPPAGRRRKAVRTSVQISFEVLQPEPERRTEVVSLQLDMEQPRS